jgi:uncharacterized membrane protein (UPF0127 family)
MLLLANNERCLAVFPLMVAVWFLFLTVLSVQAMDCPFELPTAEVSIKNHKLTVELATTPVARSCGLSHRHQLPPDHGMLFVFPDLGARTFWMKDTFIALSIAFLDAAGEILSIQKMAPDQTAEEYHSGQAVSYALEVNQGWFERNGVSVGDQVEMQLPLVLDVH